ncbi:MAG: hypothetical protein BWY05_01360 [Euryarchaeota archaeon ADurb.Bin165]|nr:MAG: hypothetical protein BWY05_01360 [Euryarchaeota archaeon ADurb.Bin165]
MKKIAIAIVVPNRTPSVVSVCILVRSLSGPIRKAVSILTSTADGRTAYPKNAPTEPPANAAWDMVNPIDEMFIWVIRTLNNAQPRDAKSIASTAWHMTLFGKINSSIRLPPRLTVQALLL